MATLATILIIGLAGPASGPAAHADRQPAAQYCSAGGIETDVQGGGLRLARAWRTVFDERFERGLGKWRISNYRNALRIDALSDSGPGVSVTRDAPETDTAFELASEPIPITPGGVYRLAVRARHDIDLQQAARHGAHFQTKIGWLGPKAQEVGETPFRFGAAGQSWYEISLQAAAPAGACSAVVRMGFDSPNLYAGRFLHVGRVTLSLRAQPACFVHQGELVSRPHKLASAGKLRLSWDAATPPGTAVKFQLRSAPDVDGGPQQWTAFSGPDGKAGSLFIAAVCLARPGHTWFQYRAVLSTADERVTPVVHCVRLGADGHAAEDRLWSGRDDSAPVLAEYSPARTAGAAGPLVFRLSDGPDGVGVDRHSVEAYLDGRPIAASLKREADGRFRYDLPSPLTPPEGLTPLDTWRLNNYNGALSIRSGPPRVAGGGPSMVVRRRGAREDTAFSFTSPAVSVQPGAAYEVSVWSRHARDLRHVGGRELATGVRWLDSAGAAAAPPSRLDLGPASPAWREQKARLIAPAGAASAVMVLGWDWPDLEAGESVELADPRIEGPHPRRSEQPNLHQVTVKASDLAGNASSRDWWIFVEPAPASGVVTKRDDGVVLVDGKPLFPIGMYAVWKREHNGNDFDRCFSELAAAGFNTAHTYNSLRGPELAAFYDAARRHSFKVIIGCQGGANNPNVRNAIGDVVAECRKPALLAWYLADDTASHISAASLRRVHEAIHDIDPFHVTVQADGVYSSQPGRSRYTDYVASTDAFLPELYPIRSDKHCEVADIVRDMKLIGADLARAGRRAPVWAIIQDFQGWGWERFPTDDEVRAMTYLAIIHGATGMTYYTYGGHGKNHGATHDPRVWANLKSVAGQLAALHDVLTERDPPQIARAAILDGPRADGLGFPSINIRLKRHQGCWYLLAANSARAPVRVSLRAAKAAGPIEVMFENRRLSAGNGAWTDQFGPYAVHVYRWRSVELGNSAPPSSVRGR